MFTIKINLHFLSEYLIVLYFLFERLCFPTISLETVALKETKAFTLWAIFLPIVLVYYDPS
jgi:hypothetical protein